MPRDRIELKLAGTCFEIVRIDITCGFGRG